MSFGKAKRFVYKVPDVDTSPADYLICTKLDKGVRISNGPRFKKSDGGEVETHPHHCTKYLEESKCCSKNSNGRHSDVFVFNRNDSTRKSIRACRKIDKTQTISFNPQLVLNETKHTDLYKSDEFIDDDYGSMTSSEDLDQLKDVEEYEFNEVYNAIKRIQAKRKTGTNHKNTLNFQDIVLKKLDRIDNNVKTIKEDIAYLPQQTFLEQLQHNHKQISENTGFKFNNQTQSFKQNQELIKSLIRKAIQNLAKKFESKEKSILKENEEKILGILFDMYATNNNSSKQIRDLCNITAEELVKKLNTVLQASSYKQGSEIENMLHEFKNKCFIKDTKNLSMNLLSDYLQQTQEVNQTLEEDLSDITLKCMDTQQMLNVQEVLLNEMRNEIENLKTSLKKN